jgi:sugar phosphate isomerase/epimerase
MKSKNNEISRREFIIRTTQATTGIFVLNQFIGCGNTKTELTKKAGSEMRLGLVTYLWGQDWDLETLIKNCEQSNVLGVELRTTHAHGVEPALSAQERKEVKLRFNDTPVNLVGLGSNENYDSPDPEILKASIEATKEFVKLSHDIGASGVKVKPNSFHDNVPQEQTIEQIGKSLNILGKFSADYNQQIRLEVHGKCSKLPTIKAIMDIADHPNVAVCWNSNDEDLAGRGLEYNFHLVKDRFGDTAHIRELNIGDYPYQQLINLFVEMDYKGWILLEARTKPDDRIIAMKEQLAIFKQMITKAQTGLKNTDKDRS